ncbi:hypothetical protein [Streptomyces sp. NPDC054866]
MGVDITVLVVDWAHLKQIPAADRLEVLQESAYSDEDADAKSDTAYAGWVWPVEPERRWLGRYEFDGTLGSYKPHFRSANAWDDVRKDVPPAQRTAVDGFLAGLIWSGPDPHDEADHTDDGVLPSMVGLWRSGPVIVRAPQTVARLVRTWGSASPVVPQLRELWGVDAPSPSFEDFNRLVTEWGEVLGEAHRRGWGVIGLPI